MGQMLLTAQLLTASGLAVLPQPDPANDIYRHLADSSNSAQHAKMDAECTIDELACIHGTARQPLPVHMISEHISMRVCLWAQASTSSRSLLLR